MTDYHWELGVDWNAIENGGQSYLQAGLTCPPAIVPPMNLGNGDTITFVVFDLTAPATMNSLLSFVIEAEAADQNQTAGDPLSSLQPAIAPNSNGLAESLFFEGTYPCWPSERVTVQGPPGNYLLTFQVQALAAPDGDPRLFVVDPEMVIGPNTPAPDDPPATAG